MINPNPKIIHRMKKIEKRRLKKMNAELDVIDEMFFPLIKKELPCSKCGMCCHIYTILLTQEDLDREPKLIPVSRLLEQSDRNRHGLDKKCVRVVINGEKRRKCPFYKDDMGCSIYKNRPEICRNYIPTLSNCLKARMAYAGFDIEAWSPHCITEYCKTRLHHNTGLCRLKDWKAVYIYSQIFPYLTLEKKLMNSGKKDNWHLIPADSSIEQLIDLNAEIPSWIREFLQLNDKYTIINDIFEPDNQRGHMLDMGNGI